MSELKVAEKWDSALEKGIKRTAYGAIAGGVVAALLFRKFMFFLNLACERNSHISSSTIALKTETDFKRIS